MFKAASRNAQRRRDFGSDPHPKAGKKARQRRAKQAKARRDREVARVKKLMRQEAIARNSEERTRTEKPQSLPEAKDSGAAIASASAAKKKVRKKWTPKRKDPAEIASRTKNRMMGVVVIRIKRKDLSVSKGSQGKGARMGPVPRPAETPLG